MHAKTFLARNGEKIHIDTLYVTGLPINASCANMHDIFR